MQLASAYIADSGCDIIMLRNNPQVAATSGMDDVDDDSVYSTLEACLWNDVVGLPMSSRVGLGAAGSQREESVWQEQIEVALELNIKHFDACLRGTSGPEFSDLRKLLDEQGVEMK